jgi:hypothetical protein
MIKLLQFKTMYDRDMVPMANAQEVGFIELSDEAIDAIAKRIFYVYMHTPMDVKNPGVDARGNRVPD